LFHFHDKIKNGATPTIGKAIEQIQLQVHMECVGIIAFMDGATSRQMLRIDLPETDTIIAQDMSHSDLGFYLRDIQVRAHDGFSLCVMCEFTLWLQFRFDVTNDVFINDRQILSSAVH
jgi:hypothetical protein